MQESIKNDLRTLISNGQTKKAIETLLSIDELKMNNQVVIISNRFNELQRKIVLNIISTENENIERNKINNSILNLINSPLSDSTVTTKNSNVDVEKRPKSNFAQIVLALSAVVTLIFTITISISNRDVVNSDTSKLKANKFEETIFNDKGTEVFSQDPISKKEEIQNLDPPIDTPIGISEQELIELAANEYLSNPPYSNNEFDKLISEKKLDLALSALNIAASKADKKYQLTRIDQRRRSIYLMKEKGFDNVWFSFPGELILTELAGKNGLYDRLGNELYKPTFDDIDPINFSPLYCTELNGQFGFINQKGEELFSPDLSYVNPIEFSPLILIEKKNKIGFINVEGELIIKVNLDTVNRVWENTILAKKNGKWGVIDTTGREKISMKYDSMEYLFDLNTVHAKLEGKSFYFTDEGKLTKNPAFQE